MPHESPLITTLVAGFVLAFLFGTLAARLRLPPLVGYLLAGIVVGPYTPGLIADAEIAGELAELGVILLMFGVGLHFSLKDLLAVRAIAVPGAVAQIGAATLMGMALAFALGWSPGAGLVFGLALSVASTVVLLRAIDERRLMDTERGRIAVGWLIVEDIAMVAVLVLLPALSAMLGGDPAGPPDRIAERLGGSLPAVLGVTFLKVAAFIALMLIVGRRVIPRLLHSVTHTGSRELFRLAVLAIALGVAFGSAWLFGVSLALGAFFAGMILAESRLSHQAAQETLPLRDAFSVLFFVAVGMLFDPMTLVEDPLPVLGVLFIIVFGKSVASFLIVIAFRHPVSTALTISASLAQIGEFSFILAELGLRLGLLPEEGRDLIVAGALLSIFLNPLAFASIGWTHAHLERNRLFHLLTPRSVHDAPARPSAEDDAIIQAARDGRTLRNHVVLVGYGRVGRLVAEALRRSGRPFVVIEDSDDVLPALRDAGIATIAGNAAAPQTMAAAHLSHARLFIVAIPDAFSAGRAVAQARAANPGLEIIARAHSDAEVEHLRALGANIVIMGEREIANGMIAEIARRSA